MRRHYWMVALLGACGGEATFDTVEEEQALRAEPRPPELLEPPEPVCRPLPVNINPRRSLFVSDLATLPTRGPAMGLRRVFEQLAAQSADPQDTAETLFARFWDTQNGAAPGLNPPVTNGPHCTNNGQTVNGFPYSCRAEGTLATNAAIQLNNAILLAAVNRFDLNDGGATHCGEYRLIYSMDQPRAFIIFEAKIPNPTPGCILGCRRLQEVWRELSTQNNPAQRSQLLQDIFFNGVPGYAPAVHINHFAGSGGGGYGAVASGQIRTNQFMQGPWVLKEMNTRQVCPDANDLFVGVRAIDEEPPETNGGGCRLDFQPVSVKANPFGPLFDENVSHPRGAAFRGTGSDAFLASVASLAVNNLNRTSFAPGFGDRFNAGESPDASVSNYSSQFQNSPNFAQAITARIPPQVGCTPNATHIVRRALANSCIGCHQSSTAGSNRDLGCGLIWPQSLGFTHVSEQFFESTPDGLAWPISPALRDVFLPERERILEHFLTQAPCLSCANSARLAQDVRVVQRAH